MNKRIRNIIAMTLTIAAATAFGPVDSAKHVLGSFGPKTVCADTLSDVSKVSIETSSGHSMDLYTDDDYDDDDEFDGDNPSEDET